MQYIDFSFLKDTMVDEENADKVISKCNEQYKSFISDSLKEDLEVSECSGCGCKHAEPDPRNIIEIHCKGIIGEGYCVVNQDPDVPLTPGDLIIVGCNDAQDIATVVEVGEVVSLKRQRMGLGNEELPDFVRVPDDNDLNKYYKNLETEMAATPFFKKKAEKCKLDMKLVDVHLQFDRRKIYFFYTSDGRVDFRELARELAGEFKTRIELRQIGVRDEAKRVGGIGTCGREYCCASFLGNFKRITTQLANEQNLSANMSKLSGPCGKLKCCLSFEVDKE